MGTLVPDISRARAAAQVLYRAFSTTGIHGRTDMPEDLLPQGMERGSLEHILFITLTVAIDYQRDAPALWKSARETYTDPATRYLFNPQKVFETSYDALFHDMQKYHLSKKQHQDAFIWRTIALTFLKKWSGDPRLFLSDCNWYAPTILSRLKTDIHPSSRGQQRDFPFLRGDKIGPLWLRMLRDNANISDLKNLDQVPIPVDIHVARASVSLGVIQGSIEGNLGDVFPLIRKVWAEGVRELTVKGHPMIALDVDEPLWHLSKYGCTYRDPRTGECPQKISCELKDFCAPGIVHVSSNGVEIQTNIY